MSGTMVALKSRGDHFIPTPGSRVRSLSPVSQAEVLESLRRAVGTVSKSGSLPYLGRWGLPLLDFSSLLSLHQGKEEVGEFLKRGQSPLFPSYWPSSHQRGVSGPSPSSRRGERLVCERPWRREAS